MKISCSLIIALQVDKTVEFQTADSSVISDYGNHFLESFMWFEKCMSTSNVISIHWDHSIGGVKVKCASFEFGGSWVKGQTNDK